MKKQLNGEQSLRRSEGTWNWLKDLSEETFDALNVACSVITLSRGDFVYRRGEEVTAIYQVVSGRVDFRTFSTAGKEVLYVHLELGDCFGELSLLDGKPAHHDAEADTDTVLMRLSKSDFHRLRQVHPEINEALVLFLARRVRSVYETLDDAFLLDVPHRLAHRLWTLYRVSQRSRADQHIVVSHEDLAKMIGSSRQSVTGILKVWEREGWLVQSYGDIEILRPDKLSEFFRE